MSTALRSLRIYRFKPSGFCGTKRYLERLEAANAKEINGLRDWDVHGSCAGWLPLGGLASVARTRIEWFSTKSTESSRDLVGFPEHPMAHKTAELERRYARRLAGLDFRNLRRGGISAPAQRDPGRCGTRQDIPDGNKPERWIYPVAAVN